MGSPPRMRGKEWYLQGESPAPGIIPACAGKSFWPCTVLPRCRDHPRVCGEKNKFQTHGGPVEGSPPRMRGKVVVLDLHQLCGGITPAYAGKSGSRRTGWPNCRDHPRVCGEKTQNPIGGQFQQGSPPRMRGKAMLMSWSINMSGITPAYAGKSPAAPHRSCR